MFFLFNIIISFILGFIDGFMGMVNENTGLGILGGLYTLFVLIPGIAVGVRRLHDVGKSGWMLLVGFIPIIGVIWLIILFATDGKPGANKWGPNPKETTAAAV